MDIDFPLILVSLVFLGAIILLVDALLWAPGRRRTLAALQLQFPQWQQQGSADHEQFQQAASQQARESTPVEYARSFLPVLAIVLVLRSFLVEPFQIPSSSMVPTLKVGDFILVNKFAYGIRLPVLGTKVVDIGEPERGDVMVFFPPHDDRYFIKRVIGLPGDQISYHNKTLTINGKVVTQEFLAALPVGRPHYEVAREQLGKVSHMIHKEPGVYRAEMDSFSVTVKPGHYFMMGDNRDNSSDSRKWGQVPEENIVGKAFAVWMHWKNITDIPSFSTVGVIQ